MTNNILYYPTPSNPNSQVFLKRPRIDYLLSESVQKPITTIVAGAGYGKTQAVYSFLQEYDAITIWLQLSPFDNLVTRLWENFVYAISLQNEELASSLMALGFPETMGAYDRFLVLISKSIKSERKYILVFDDFHLIHEKSTMLFFERFINARINNLSIIFIARSEPNLNTIRLLSKGLVSSINENDLLFSQDEMIHYFQMQNIQLSSKAIEDTYNYSGGWIFAIHLVGLSLKKGQIQENDALPAVKENIFRLMESEIFSIVSKEMQDFLIKLSLIDNMPFELLKELFPHSDELITEMSTISSFIRYDAFIDTYRIHHLLFSFLSEKQAVLNPEETNEIYARSASWYIKNGHVIHAITYYEKINKYDEILQIILDYPTFLSEETANFMLSVLERASSAKSDDSYLADILHAKFLLNLEKYEEDFTQVSLLRKKYESLPMTEKNLYHLCGVYINLGTTCLYTGSCDFKMFYKMAYDTSQKLVKQDYTYIFINYACKVICSDAGAFDNYINALVEITPYTDVMHGFGFGCADLAMTEFAYYQKNLKSAEKHAYQAIIKAQQKKQDYIEYMAIFYLIRINVSLGNYTKITELLEQLSSQVKDRNLLSYYNVFDIISGWFYSLIGQADQVAAWIKCGPEIKKSTLHNYGWELLAQARFKFSQQKYYETLAILENLEENNRIGKEVLGLIEIKSLKAVSLYCINEQEAAISNLQSAYDLASPNSLDMPFIEHGKHMRTLANNAIKSSDCTIPNQWLENITTKSSTYAKKLAHIVFDYEKSNQVDDKMPLTLSKKEKEILTDLSHGLTKEETAVNCDISVNTVKSMLVNIHKKLGATNTLDAVRIATLMQLIK